MKDIEIAYNQFIEQKIPVFEKYQEQLDETIRESQSISLYDWNNDIFYHHAHHIALKNEVNEFINECRDIWKYWKNKPVDIDALIDEYVDIIHFVLLIHNKDYKSYRASIRTFREIVFQQTKSQLSTGDFYIELLYKLEGLSHIQDILAHATFIILDYYQFSVDDIVQAYHRKNQVNIDRQNNNY